MGGLQIKRRDVASTPPRPRNSGWADSRPSDETSPPPRRVRRVTPDGRTPDQATRRRLHPAASAQLRMGRLQTKRRDVASTPPRPPRNSGWADSRSSDRSEERRVGKG